LARGYLALALCRCLLGSLTKVSRLRLCKSRGAIAVNLL
jgi:hypothetical protein